MSDTQQPVIGLTHETLCSICAWRADCKKKFSFDQGGTVKCLDFTKDAAIKEQEGNDK